MGSRDGDLSEEWPDHDVSSRNLNRSVLCEALDDRTSQREGVMFLAPA